MFYYPGIISKKRIMNQWYEFTPGKYVIMGRINNYEEINLIVYGEYGCKVRKATIEER